MSMPRRFASVVSTLFVWGVVLAGAGLLVAVGIGPRTGRYRTLTVLSGSMTPGIPIGSVLVVTPERPDRMRVGQVVTYAIPVDNHRVVSHRVVKILEGGSRPVFQTKGDANDAPDPWIAQVNDRQVWRVRYVIPHLGAALQWLRRPAVHTATVLVAPAVVAVSVLVGIWRRDSDEGELGGDEPGPDAESVRAKTREAA